MRWNSSRKLHAWPTAASALLRAAATTALIASMAGGIAAMAPAANASSRVPPPKPAHSLVPPLQTIINSSGSFNVPAISRCPRNSFTGQASGTVATKIYGIRVSTTTLHAVFCYNNKFPNGRVTGVIKITVEPEDTRTGRVPGWDYDGLVPGTSDGYYFNDTGYPNSGYHIFREAHWHLCPPIRLSCYDDAYIKMNMNLHYNGTHSFYLGNDHD
jgi:hypothetical protein